MQSLRGVAVGLALAIVAGGAAVALHGNRPAAAPAVPIASATATAGASRGRPAAARRVETASASATTTVSPCASLAWLTADLRALARGTAIPRYRLRFFEVPATWGVLDTLLGGAAGTEADARARLTALRPSGPSFAVGRAPHGLWRFDATRTGAELTVLLREPSRATLHSLGAGGDGITVLQADLAFALPGTGPAAPPSFRGLVADLLAAAGAGRLGTVQMTTFAPLHPAAMLALPPAASGVVARSAAVHCPPVPRVDSRVAAWQGHHVALARVDTADLGHGVAVAVGRRSADGDPLLFVMIGPDDEVAYGVPGLLPPPEPALMAAGDRARWTARLFLATLQPAAARRLGDASYPGPSAIWDQEVVATGPDSGGRLQVFVRSWTAAGLRGDMVEVAPSGPAWRVVGVQDVTALRRTGLRLLTEWLRARHYKSFVISDVTLAQLTHDGFVFTARFSVQCATPSAACSAGNGATGPDGWVAGKFLFVTVAHGAIKTWATSPPWA